MTEVLAQLHDAVLRTGTRKTWKREVAAVQLLVWLVCTVYLIIFAALDRMNMAATIYGIATAAIHTFALGAYGFEAWDKRIARLGQAPPPLPAGATGSPVGATR